MNGALDGGIRPLDYLAGLFLSVGKDFTAALTEILRIIFIFLESIFKFFLLLANLHALIFPISAVTGNVEQILVHVDIIRPDNLLGALDNLLREPYFARNFNGKRRAGSTNEELKHRFHALAVIKH